MLNVKLGERGGTGLLSDHGDYLTFYDANMEHMACLRNWHNDGPWLFTLGSDGDWVSLRRANDRDCAALGVPGWMHADAEPNGTDKERSC